MTKQTIRQRIQYVSAAGIRMLHDQLDSLKSEATSLRAKLAELRQLKGAEDFDLVTDKLHLAFLEKEAERTKEVLAHSKLLESLPRADGTVRIGSVVKLQPSDAGDSEVMSCVLVSSLEANPLEGKISDQSPLGMALLGKMKDAIVRVAGPHKDYSYRILGVE